MVLSNIYFDFKENMGAFIFLTLIFVFTIIIFTTTLSKLFLRSKKISDLVSFYKNRNRLPDWFTELLSESHTNTIVVHRLGARRTIVTANPSNVEHILKINFYNFPKGKPFTDILGDFLGQGIFNVDGDTWLNQRRMASHEFTTRTLREFLMRTLTEEVNGRLIPALNGFLAASRVFDLQELLARFSFNVICKFTLGSDNMCSLDPSVPISPLARAFDLAAAISARRGATPFFFVWKMKKWLGVGSEKRLREAVTEVHSHVMNLIREKKQKINVMGEDDGNGTTKDFLSRLICAGYGDDVIRDMVISFLMAGRDTTSSAMTWFFWLLSHYPDLEHKILEETEEKTNGILDYESLKKLNFLKACLCESMRLFPPVAWDSKHAVSDDVLPDGTVVKAGDRVTYFPYGMGRMVNLWGLDCDQFRPDRWYAEEEEKHGRLSEVSPYKFPIFQAGPRVCLGKEMAFTQIKFVVVSILQRFQIKALSPNKPIFVPLLTAHMAGGLQILLSKREKT